MNVTIRHTTREDAAAIEKLEREFADYLVSVGDTNPHWLDAETYLKEVFGAEPHTIQGNPDPDKISTSFAERQNLTMRMSMRRFTRLTNAFSKKIDNHIFAIALYFMHYNFARPHKTLANPYPRTPAMAAGVSDHIWTIEEIVQLAD